MKRWMLDAERRMADNERVARKWRGTRRLREEDRELHAYLDVVFEAAELISDAIHHIRSVAR